MARDVRQNGRTGRDELTRLALLEEGHDDLHNRIESIDNKLDRVVASLNDMQSRLATVGKTDWRTVLVSGGAMIGVLIPVVTGIVSLFAVFVMLVTQPIDQRVGHTALMVAANAQEVEDHFALEAHPGALVKNTKVASEVEALKAQVSMLDDRDQARRSDMKMDLLDRIGSLRHELQREMADKVSLAVASVQADLCGGRMEP